MTQLISVQGNPALKTPTSKPLDSKLTLRLNTIVLIVGPQGSGKSEFINEHLVPTLQRFQVGQKPISVIVADFQEECERLLGYQVTKKQKEQYVYPQIHDEAEDLLFARIKHVTSYPINSDFVIVDGSGMREDFREKVLAIAEENHYRVSLVVFDYKNISDYYYGPDKTPTHPGKIKPLRQLLSGGLPKLKYPSVFKISNRQFKKIEIEVEDYEYYDQFYLPVGPEYVIIGDIHGCLEEFKALLVLNGFVINSEDKVSHPEGKRVVLLGDLVDKGYDIAGVIEFVYKNLNFFYMVLGNHEAFVYRSLTKLISAKDVNPEVRKEFFETYDSLKEYVRPSDEYILQQYVQSHTEDFTGYYHFFDLTQEEVIERYFAAFPAPTEEETKKQVELRNKFFAISEAMKSFYIHPDFIVTHAPAAKKHLAKITDAALKAARDFRYPKLKEFPDLNLFFVAFDEQIAFLKTEANERHPFHIFGHVMSEGVGQYKNKVCIDTGCVSGGQLTSAIVKGKSIEFKNVDIINEKKIHKKKLFKFFS